jgi:hypothetical protein
VVATRGALRLGRSAALGTSCLLLSLAAHVLAGGAAPSLTAMLVLAVPVSCASVLVTGRRAGLLRIGAVLGLTQVGLHQAFGLLTQSTCVGGAPELGHSLGGHMAGSTSGCVGPLAHVGSLPVATSMHMAGSSLMVAGHVVAAAGTALLLWQGERLLWALLGWLAWTVRPVADVRTVPAPRLRAGVAVRRVAGSVSVPGGVGRRGPPLLTPS